MTIRPIQPGDVSAVVRMVHDLAEYERAPDQCTLTDSQLTDALFGPSPALYGHVAEDGAGGVAGFALWFLNFSTWRGEHGIYLEDFYIRPEVRGTGLGRSLLATLAAIATERGYARLDWAVLHWNTPAREVYHALGAEPLDEWVPYRVEGEALVKLAAAAPDPGQSGHGGAQQNNVGSPIGPPAS
ncbi:MAG: hypothetical protein QOD41_4941 [Cryptosporangiaceae bacterium]|nr:hypothetical protein [Cryptosporangiaceae bacterium]